MKIDFRLAVFGLAVLSLTVGCDLNNVGSDHLYPACEPPSGVQTSLIFPAPDATGVPSTLSEIVFGSTVTSGELRGLNANELAYLVVSNASPAPLSPLSQDYAPVGAATIAPNAVPSPNALNTNVAVYLQRSASSGVTWPYNATLSVYLGAQNGECNPYTYMGSFTIQTPPPTP